MEATHCSCTRKGNLTYFCIQQGCQLDPRLCARCRRQHENHNMIEINHLSSLDAYKINMSMHKKEEYKQQLEQSLKKLESMKLKMIEDATNAINEQFDKWIGHPIYLLMSTTEIQQEQKKRATIYDQETKKEELLEIAHEIRQLSKGHFKDSQFIRVMMKRLIDQFSHGFKEAIDGQIKQLSALAAEKMEPLSPFSNKMVDIIQKQKLEERKIAQEKQWLQKEQQRADFLSPFGEVIKLNGSQVSVEKWKESGKPFVEIPNLYLNKKNLEIIPFQIKFFPNLAILQLKQNKIKEIQNLANLTKLQQLRLYNNEITQIKNLSKLTNLRLLNLQTNSITEIKGLEKLTNLQTLNLRGNSITQIKGLEKLINLKELGLNNNPITAIKNLENLTQLENLSIDQCKIQKLENISHLAKLQKLWIYGNPLMNIEAEKQKIEQLKTKGIKVYVKNNSE